MNIVILGCGRVGAALAQLLVGEGHRVKIIDQDSESFNRLGTDFPEGHTVLGNGTDEDVLRRAGISRADAFVAVTNGDLSAPPPALPSRSSAAFTMIAPCVLVMIPSVTGTTPSLISRALRTSPAR